jgi:hypothetical protein
LSNRNINSRTGVYKIQAFETATNNICTTSENILISTSGTTTVNVDTNGCTDSGSTSTCENTSNTYVDQWYSFTMPVNGNLKITNSNIHDIYTLFDSCSGTEIDCFDWNDTFYNLTNATTYILRLSNRKNNSRTGIFKIQAFETATNDICSNAINLNVGIYDEFIETKTLFGTSSSTNSLPTPSCGILGSGEDVWFTVQVPSSGSLTIETSQASSSLLDDTILQIFSGVCGVLTEIGCDDNSGNGNFSKLTLNSLTAGDTLYIRLFENGSNVADYYNIFAYESNCTEKTIWDNTGWSNGIPNSNYIVEINDNYNTDTGNIDACMCKIKSGVLVNVNSDQYIKVENHLVNNGILKINHQGSFVQVDENSTIIGNGSYKTVIKTTGLQDTNRFTYISSPVQNNALSILSVWAKMDYLWDFDGLAQDWRHIPNVNTIMTPGKGFAVEGDENLDYSSPYIATTNFTGKFNTGTIVQTIYYNSDGIDDDNTLVGNPYPSAIDISKLLDSNINPSVNSIYVWTHNSELISGSYQNDDYIVCSSINCVSAYAGNNGNNLNGFLASGQGFFVSTVNATSNILTFNNEMRATDNNLDFRRTENYEQLWLNISSELGYFNQIAVNFTPYGTIGFDHKIDALRLGNSYGLGFYSIGNNNERLAINDKGLLINEITVPLGLYVNDNQVSNLNISIDHFQNMDGLNIYIKDNLTNILHNLKESNYDFMIYETGVFNNRFELILSRNTLDNQEYIEDNTISVIQNSNKEIVIKSDLEMESIYIYDVIGKLQLKKEIKTNYEKFILNKTQSSILFIKVKMKSGKIETKKILYNH